MAQLVVRKLDPSVKARLQQRARRHRRSMEEEVREILQNAVKADRRPAGGLGSEIVELFAKVGLSADLPELRGHTIRPPTFEP